MQSWIVQSVCFNLYVKTIYDKWCGRHIDMLSTTVYSVFILSATNHFDVIV